MTNCCSCREPQFLKGENQRLLFALKKTTTWRKLISWAINSGAARPSIYAALALNIPKTA